MNRTTTSFSRNQDLPSEYRGHLVGLNQGNCALDASPQRPHASKAATRNPLSGKSVRDSLEGEESAYSDVRALRHGSVSPAQDEVDAWFNRAVDWNEIVNSDEFAGCLDSVEGDEWGRDDAGRVEASGIVEKVEFATKYSALQRLLLDFEYFDAQANLVVDRIGVLKNRHPKRAISIAAVGTLVLVLFLLGLVQLFGIRPV